MAKKKKNTPFRCHKKQQYCHILRGCEQIDQVKLPLVNNIIYNLKNINIPTWRNLTKVQKVAFFFEYIADKNWVAVTLRFSNNFIENCIQEDKKTDFIRRRLNENFKNRLGSVPEYLFCVEFKNNVFHTHGAIKPDDSIEIIEEVLKTTAFGKNYKKNPIPEKNKIMCKPIYDSQGWGRYVLKSCNHPNFDIYVCTPIIRKISEKYHDLHIKQRLIKYHLQRLA